MNFNMLKCFIAIFSITLLTGSYATADADDMISILEEKGEYDIFIDLVNRTDIAGDIIEGGPYTIFVPTNEAFDHLPPEVLDGMREDTEELAYILQFHMLPKAQTAEQIGDQSSVPSVQGNEIYVYTRDDQLMINEATVLEADIEYNNGIIHVIDTVLLPR